MSLLHARDDRVVDIAGSRGRDRFRALYSATVGLSQLVDTYRSAITAADFDTSTGAGRAQQ
jgi:hypothetical protein